MVALDFCEMVGTASNSGTGGEHTRVWLRNLFTEPIGSLPECNVPDGIDEPYVAKGAECYPLEPVDGESTNVETPNEDGETESEPVEVDRSGGEPNSAVSRGEAVYATGAAMFDCDWMGFVWLDGSIHTCILLARH
jgi:hypothetical protein